MGVHVSFVRSLDLDSFSEQDVKKLLCGGNQNCREFFVQHGLELATESSSAIATHQASIVKLYHTDVARLYREVLNARVQGRPEPKMQDLFPEEQMQFKQTCSNKIDGTNNKALSNICAQNKMLLSKNRMPTPLECFMGGIKYWSNRYILLPLFTKEI
jgi:hypothetical protein